MEHPTEEEIIEQAEFVKSGIKQIKIKETEYKKILMNQMNKLLRMLKNPVRRVEFESWIGKEIPRRKTTSRKINRNTNSSQ